MANKASKPHSLVVGSGAGGMTMAVLLALAGRRVTLLEATPRVGGLLRRFHRQGVPFDTGFHFTGGFGNALPRCSPLGITDLVHEEPFQFMYLTPTGSRYDWPRGVRAIVNTCPNDSSRPRKIFAYYQAEQDALPTPHV